jgi:hypothetical protein
MREGVVAEAGAEATRETCMAKMRIPVVPVSREMPKMTPEMAAGIMTKMSAAKAPAAEMSAAKVTSAKMSAATMKTTALKTAAVPEGEGVGREGECKA